VVGGGVGTAVVYPSPRPGRRGVKVTRSSAGDPRMGHLEDELRACGDVVVCTDDRQLRRPGFVTEALKELCESGGIDQVFAVGPVR